VMGPAQGDDVREIRRTTLLPRHDVVHVAVPDGDRAPREPATTIPYGDRQPQRWRGKPVSAAHIDDRRPTFQNDRDDVRRTRAPPVVQVYPPTSAPPGRSTAPTSSAAFRRAGARPR
jgi:hypothetical protein